jgi:hypothetical protein
LHDRSPSPGNPRTASPTIRCSALCAGFLWRTTTIMIASRRPQFGIWQRLDTSQHVRGPRVRVAQAAIIVLGVMTLSEGGAQTNLFRISSALLGARYTLPRPMPKAFAMWATFSPCLKRRIASSAFARAVGFPTLVLSECFCFGDALALSFKQCI